LSEYKVALEVYNGPLDLLLFLIRREEVDIHDIPIARVTEQYVAYVELLEQLDPDAAGDFLVLAATLMEIKSRMLLPQPPPEEATEELGDPRLELVRQLLEYKKYKDAAGRLEQAADLQMQRAARAPAMPETTADELELDSVEVWDLFEAFRRLLEQTGRTAPVHRVGVDDTPIALHAADIVDALDRADGRLLFEEVFQGRSKPEMIGLFLALLELIRQRRVRAAQDRPFGPIVIILLDPTPLDPSLLPTEVVETPEPERNLAHTAADVAPADSLDEVSGSAAGDSDGDATLFPAETDDDPARTPGFNGY